MAYASIKGPVLWSKNELKKPTAHWTKLCISRPQKHGLQRVLKAHFSSVYILGALSSKAKTPERENEGRDFSRERNPSKRR